jgi:hypothetical protein
MLPVRYPEPSFKIKAGNGKELIFDILRKRWGPLTSEEWVRQNFIQFLLQDKKYPSARIAVEKEIRLGELRKRFDVLVYDSSHQPWMMIECKGREIQLNESVLEQVLRYNISVPVQYLIITNGNDSMGWLKKDKNLVLIDELPDFVK